MIAIIKRPGEHFQTTLIENKLSEICNIIDGAYATARISEDACFIYNPDAIRESKRYNFTSGAHDFYGNVLMCGVNNGRLVDLPKVYQEAILLLGM